jgi:hypothetical protein
MMAFVDIEGRNEKGLVDDQGQHSSCILLHFAIVDHPQCIVDHPHLLRNSIFLFLCMGHIKWQDCGRCGRS